MSSESSIDTSVRKDILDRLDRIEREEDVRILYACESGSRAWGFASTDSDYDVRFIYVRPRDWYLSIEFEKQRDVIELPIQGELDISGWDLRKALKLAHHSNPPLLEWLQSPIVYRTTPEAGRIAELAFSAFSPQRCRHHYLNMAKGDFKEHLKKDLVWRKKYLYVLRPLLAILWLNEGRGLVPVRFEELVSEMMQDPELLRLTQDLVQAKRNGQELDNMPRIDPLNRFIEFELERAASAAPTGNSGLPDLSLFDEFFRSCLDA